MSELSKKTPTVFEPDSDTDDIEILNFPSSSLIGKECTALDRGSGQGRKLKSNISESTVDLYFRLGHALIPISKKPSHPGKRPLHKNWTKRDYDSIKIKEYAEDGYNIGFRLGRDDFVIDVDPRNGGDEGLKRLCSDWALEYLADVAPAVRTGGNGSHYYLKIDPRVKTVETLPEYPGIEFKRHGRQVIIPGSVHYETGRFYEFDPNSPFDKTPPPVPTWLVEKLAREIKQSVKTFTASPHFTDSELTQLLEVLPVNEYNTNERWLPILMSAHQATAGKGLQSFLDWSLSDPEYRGHKSIVKQRWASLKETRHGVTYMTLFKEVRKHGGVIPRGIQIKADFADSEISQPRPTRTDEDIEIVGLEESRAPTGTGSSDVETTKRFFKCSDLGNSERLVAYADGKIRYCASRKKWLIFNERKGVFDWDDTGKIIEIAKRAVREIYREASRCDDDAERVSIARHAKQSEAASRIKAMVELARSDNRVAVLPEDIDANPYLLGCPDGLTLDLRSLTVREADPSDLITKTLGAPYSPDATHVLWERALRRWTDGDKELASYLQKVAGYALFGQVPEKAFWFLFGPPDCGKSRFLDAIRTAFGDYAQIADFDTWLVQSHTGGNRGDLVDLMGARLVISDETRKGARFDERVMKTVSSGGGQFKVAAKYEAVSAFDVQFVLFLAANDPPIIRDDDAGSWTRAKRVPFTSVIPESERDPSFKEKVTKPKVLRAILRWAVEGYAKWKSEGLGSCAAVENSTRQYRAEMDRFEGFVSECCRLVPSEKTLKSDLWNAYSAWVEGEGISPLSRRDFNKRLSETGCSSARKDGNKAWLGITLKTRPDFELEFDSIDGDRHDE